MLLKNIVKKLIEGTELTDQDLKEMNDEINRLIVSRRYLFYWKFFSKKAVEESKKGFG